MKNTYFFFILFCSLFLLAMTACERTDIQKPSVNDKVSPRTDDCDDCPIDDCCCGFELRDPNDATTFRVCGFDNGTATCAPTPPSGCGTISGGFISQLFNSADPKFEFCMLQGNCFQIENITPGSTGQIKITCDYDVLNPTFTNVTIPYGQTFTWCIDGNCNFEQCDP